ncbi:mitochondrial acyl carrier protein [Entomophthora muscae]|uniref:Mitochondrial acyl carrier protein n=1 Tax=Entomophthora muscae TaxID=34485 RepID=A0ACC2TM38_9FUNG|nr:mitochondrial acyl carrier protein [Entomophthora muscae]
MLFRALNIIRQRSSALSAPILAGKPIFYPTQFYSSHGGLTKELIGDRVLELLGCFDKIEPEKLTDKAHFVKDLSLDSLDTVEIIMAIEEEFQIEIPDHDADEIKTVKDIIEYISLREEAI